MTYRARIYLRRVYAETFYQYIGEIEIDRPPAENGQIRFTHHGKIELGSVDSISPVDWDRRGVIPVLHVVLNPHEIPEEKPHRAGRG